MAKLDVTVKSDGRAYKVEVDNKIVTLTDGKGKTESLAAGKSYDVTWELAGKAGNYLSVDIQQAGVSLTPAAKYLIPDGEEHAHGLLTIRVQ